MLSPEKYLSSVINTQIITIDLIVKNSKHEILLGKRKNFPAKGVYFVPCGHVYKNETIKEGAYRMLQWELGVIGENKNLRPRCVSEHIYEENFAGKKDKDGKFISTHYVSFAFDIHLDEINESIFLGQHEDILWLSEKEILKRDDIHEYVKLYFKPDAYNRF